MQASAGSAWVTCYGRVIVVVMGQRRLRAPQRWFLLSEPGASAVTCQRANRWRERAVRSCACLDASLPSLSHSLDRPPTPLPPLPPPPPRTHPPSRRQLSTTATAASSPARVDGPLPLPVRALCRAGERREPSSGHPPWPPAPQDPSHA